MGCRVLERGRRIGGAIEYALGLGRTAKGRIRGQRRRLLHENGSSNKRSVVFLHNSYYHFYYLAQALRRRGWDAVTVT